MNPHRAIFLLSITLAVLFASVDGALAEVKSAGAGSFLIEQELILPASPEAVYDTVTGDISPWWDHSFSGKPKKLYIEARPGGGFYEIFDDAGNGVLHATVIYAERGKKLRFTGPLGFSGTPLDMVTTYDLKPEGTGTRFHLTVAATGKVDESTAKLVDQVWQHFLVERIKPYIESAEYKKPHSSVGAAPAPSAMPASVPATLADFAWMAGRWSGNVGKNPIEYECSQPRDLQMMCMFRVFDEKNVLALEFISLLETPAGMKEHISFLTPALESNGPGAVTLELESIAPDHITFVNLAGTRPKRSTVLRNGNDAFTSHIEMIDDQGKASTMEAHWQRLK